MNGWRQRLATAAIMAIALGASARAPAGEPPLEYRVKAAFVARFVSFVEWPAGAGPKPNTPVTVGVAGDGPQTATMVEALTALGATTAGGSAPRIQLRRLKSPHDLEGCQIVYVTAEATAGAAGTWPADVLSRLGDAPVLTVGESPTFLADGGMVAFFFEDERVRFNFNLAAIERSQLRVSSALLQLAHQRAKKPPAGD